MFRVTTGLETKRGAWKQQLSVGREARDLSPRATVE